MNNQKNLSFYTYCKQVLDFDESTLLTPNIAGKDEGKISKIILELQDDYDKFSKDNHISKNDLFMAATSLALNKFNFSDKSLIFNAEDNAPLVFKFEDRTITIRQYLEEISKISNMIKFNDGSFEELYKDYNVKPEFYYSYNDDINLNDESYSNYLNISDDDGIILSFSFNDQLYSKEYIEIFLNSIKLILNQIVSSNLDTLTISDIYLEEENDEISFTEVELPYLHKRFEQHAKNNGDKVALVAVDETLTYAQLNEKANRIANALIKKGVEPG